MPSTPVTTALASPAPISDSPGTWRHPRLNEITRRRNATTFSEKNVRQIVYGAAGIISLWLLRAVLRRFMPNLVPGSAKIWTDWVWIIAQLVPALNILSACLPLIRREDDLSDIPLTPAQRKLLGLPPSSAPPTPDATYSTPPRLSRSPSIAGSVGSQRSYASSPLSGRGSPALLGQSGSPYSPMGSPVYNKGLDVAAGGRRSSIGGGSPFGASSSTNLFSDPSSPSPGGKRTSVGLNSKWLYERGRRSSGGNWSR